MTEDDLASALTALRRSYRLLYDWQRRVHDLHAAVDTTLRQEGLTFQRWRPLFNSPPARAGTPFFRDRWTWDMLPGWATSTRWGDERRRGPARTRRRVVFQCLVDTGRRYDGDEPDPARFLPVEEATSELRVGLWTSDAATPDWGAAYQRVQARDADGWDWTGELALQVDEDAYTYAYRGVALATLVDAAATRRALLDPLQAWCAAR